MTEPLIEMEIQQFINDGFIKLENAFSRRLAKEALRFLWRDTNCDPLDSTTWSKPVIRLGDYGQEPFKKAANSALLHSAFNQLAGKGNWIPCNSLGSFPVRFPSLQDPGDTGWHVDASFPAEDQNNYLNWRVNVKSKGRALLMLFLFSDVEETDAPTRIIVNSHFKVAKLLESKGDAGLSFTELAKKLDIGPDRKEILATGKAGTVYLCHPFLVHAAQAHRGKNPRFMAQAALLHNNEFEIYRVDKNYCPVEAAIRKGIGLDTSYSAFLTDLTSNKNS